MAEDDAPRCAAGYHRAPDPTTANTTCPCGLVTRVHRPADEEPPDD